MKILMVCLGNICRSPLAEGILRHKIEQHGLNVVIDSAGTGAWHTGENPDRRAVMTAKKFGVDISGLKARKFCKEDFEIFDKIFVMDRQNYRDVLRHSQRKDHFSKVELLLNADQPGSGREVPDPWYGEEEGFIEVYALIEKACDAIVAELKKNVCRPESFFLSRPC